MTLTLGGMVAWLIILRRVVIFYLAGLAMLLVVWPL